MLKGVNETLSNMDLHDLLQDLPIIPNTCHTCVFSFYLLNRPKHSQLLRTFECFLVYFCFYVWNILNNFLLNPAKILILQYFIILNF